ncbi:hypothetical protein LSAT2_008284 [Lamellibrachia satsuma]|nr:hypothetical protein LSAT2_008284 [Lamellibrachia satsuma]
MDNMLAGDTTAGQNATEGIRHKSFSEIVIEGVRRRARVFVRDSIVRQSAKQGDDVVICFPGAKIEAMTERVERIWGPGKTRQRRLTSLSKKHHNKQAVCYVYTMETCNIKSVFMLTLLTAALLADWCDCDNSSKIVHALKLCNNTCKNSFLRCIRKRQCGQSVLEQRKRCNGYLEACKRRCSEAAFWTEVFEKE